MNPAEVIADKVEQWHNGNRKDVVAWFCEGEDGERTAEAAAFLVCAFMRRIDAAEHDAVETLLSNRLTWSLID